MKHLDGKKYAGILFSESLRLVGEGREVCKNTSRSGLPENTVGQDGCAR